MKREIFAFGLMGFCGALCAQTATVTNHIGDFRVRDDTATTEVTEGRFIADRSISIGANNLSGKWCTMNVGWGSTTLSNYSYAIGENSVTSEAALHSLAVGLYAKAYERHSLLFGSWVSSYSPFTVVMGYQTYVKATHSLVFGYGSKVGRPSDVGENLSLDASYNIALGRAQISMGSHNILLGSYAKVGDSNTDMSVTSDISYATAIGYKASAQAGYSTALGYEVSTQTAYQTTLGVFNAPLEVSGSAWNDADPLFVVGNGRSASARSNALVMSKNGDTRISGALEANTMTAQALKLTETKGGIAMGRYNPPAQQ